MTEEQLIQGCRNKDRKAAAELFRIYAPKMMGVCCRYVKERSEAEDIVHDGFVVVFTRIENYRGEGSFEGWMRRIFINLSINYIKSNNRTETLDGTNEIVGYSGHVEPEVFKNIGLTELMNTIDKLPDGLRAVLSLFSIDGYTHEEIAGMLNISVRSSESRLYRAKKMLVKLIDHEGRI